MIKYCCYSVAGVAISNASGDGTIGGVGKVCGDGAIVGRIVSCIGACVVNGDGIGMVDVSVHAHRIGIAKGITIDIVNNAAGDIIQGDIVNVNHIVFVDVGTSSVIAAIILILVLITPSLLALRTAAPMPPIMI